MAMTGSGRSPGVGATWALACGLGAVFLGERVLGHLPAARLVASGLGVVVVLAMTGWRLAAFARRAGAARRVEGILLLGSAGCLAAVALYFGGALLVGADRARVHAAITVGWLLLGAVSLLPLLFAQWTAARGADEVVEEARVREAASAGLTTALAAALLLVVGFIVSERDVKVDVSYFKTSMPGSATAHMVEGLGEPLRVLLFFPEVNEVEGELRGYFEELARSGGDKVTIERHDRMASPALAKEYKVTRDGTVVLVKGKQSESLTFDTKMTGARSRLRTLDADVQKALMKIARGPRVAYFTTGHGEMTDPSDGAEPLGTAQLMRELLLLLNYRVNDLGLKSGLATDVPDDAALVLVVGAKKPFLDEELAALDRYLARGGALFLALDPAGELKLGPLEQRLGVRFDPTPLADDRQHLRQRNNASDNRLLVTDQFSSHAAVTSLSRSRAGAGIVVPFAGALADADLKAVPEADRPTRTYVVRSLPSAFADADGDNLPGANEKRESKNLVAAIEGKAPPEAAPGKAEAARRPMRAFVLASAAMVSDPLLSNVALSAALVGDGVKWLGGEEQLAGETISEKDVPIEHTKSGDVAWFYGTIAGAPLVLLGLGLFFTTRRRRGSR